MNPITHAGIGWLIAQGAHARRDRVWITAAAVIPDLDGLTLLGGLEAYGRYHHTFGHNLFAAAAATLACAGLATPGERARTALLGAVAFHSHLLGDLLGSGAAWPILYFWPWRGDVWSFSPPYQWELDCWQNLLITALVLGAIYGIGRRHRRTLIEVVSTRADARVVAALRQAFVRRP